MLDPLLHLVICVGRHHGGVEEESLLCSKLTAKRKMATTKKERDGGRDEVGRGLVRSCSARLEPKLDGLEPATVAQQEGARDNGDEEPSVDKHDRSSS